MGFIIFFGVVEQEESFSSWDGLLEIVYSNFGPVQFPCAFCSELDDMYNLRTANQAQQREHNHTKDRSSA